MIICAACGGHHENCGMIELMGGSSSLPVIEREVIDYQSPPTISAPPPSDILPRNTDWTNYQG